MKKILIALLTTLTLSSCAAFERTVDYTAERTERLVEFVRDEAAQLKTETLNEVGKKIEEVVPVAVEAALNTEAVAFLVVSITCILAFLTVVAGLLLLGAMRTLYMRWRAPKDC